MLHTPNSIWMHNEPITKTQRVLRREQCLTATPSRVSHIQAKEVRNILSPEGHDPPCAHMLTSSLDSARQASRVRDSRIHTVGSPNFAHSELRPTQTTLPQTKL